MGSRLCNGGLGHGEGKPQFCTTVRSLASGPGAADRQSKVVNRLLEAGPGGFEGGLANRKYRGMTKASAATALRDLQDLADRGFLVRRESGGRSTAYDLPWEAILEDTAEGG